MEDRIPKKGDIYLHFKGSRYQVIAVAEHSETKEELVIYEGLYGEHKVYARPMSMFLEKIDKEKYKKANQTYRFELCEEEELPENGPAMLIDFLNMETYEEKLAYLEKIRLDISENFLVSAAVSLDFAEAKETIDERYEDLRNYLRTLIQYEQRRLRY